MTDLVLVSYLNTIPFLQGLETKEGLELFRLHKRKPSDCADMYATLEADIALLPVGALPNLPDYRIITDYCIGSVGSVKTVVLMSHSPIEDVDRIYLDQDSRTSRLLTKVICGDFLNRDMVYEDGIPLFPLTIGASDATLMIGDKVFYYEDHFKYKYDLGELWMKYTDLAFAFAVWVARPNVEDRVVDQLNSLLSKGVVGLDHSHYENEEGIDLDTYFTKYISYDLDDQKLKAIDQFLKLGKKYL